MKVTTKLIFLNEQDEKFFGEGPYRLLKKVEETGSLRAGAFELGMAYSKATKLIKNAEQSLGFPLTVRKIGGKSGGGSVLTDQARDFMMRYEAYRTACIQHNQKLYEQYFGTDPKYGCVIMASGMGKRFGGDKLMTELLGKPMIQYIVEATEGLFEKRVVVTRNKKVESWCLERQIPVVCHELPGRNDTVRLGIQKLNEGMEGMLWGCVFCQADMPFVKRESLKKMLSMAAEQKEGIYRMSYQGQLGSPVLFGKEYFAALKSLSEGKGGSEIIKDNSEKVRYVEAMDEYELWDMDTREDYDKIREIMEQIHNTY